MIRLADKGHVYGSKPELGKDFNLSLIGLNKASTFTGFCAKHDTSLFRALETEVFQGTESQIFLLTYRALCRELYVKRGSIMQSAEVAGLDIPNAVQELVEGDLYASNLSLSELLAYKTKADTMLLSGDTNDLQFYMFAFNSVPQVMCNAWTSAEYDFLGRVAQEIKMTADPIQGMAFNMLGTSVGGVAVFSWLDRGLQQKRMAQSLDRMGDRDIPDDLVRFAFEFCENIYVGPAWWHGVQKEDAERLVRRIISGTPLSVRNRNCLIGDGVRVATWKLMSRSKKI